MAACHVHRVPEAGCVDCLEDQRDNLQIEVNNLRTSLQISGLEPKGEKCVRCSWMNGKVLKECWPCAEIRRLGEEVAELKKKLSQIKTAVCAECSGGGEIGLADGEVPCPTCGGSGDPTRPGVFAPKKPTAPVVRVGHCSGPHCFVYGGKSCICLCAKCKDALVRDH